MEGGEVDVAICSFGRVEEDSHDALSDGAEVCGVDFAGAGVVNCGVLGGGVEAESAVGEAPERQSVRLLLTTPVQERPDFSCCLRYSVIATLPSKIGAIADVMRSSAVSLPNSLGM